MTTTSCSCSHRSCGYCSSYSSGFLTLKTDGKTPSAKDLFANSDTNGEINVRISFTSHVGAGSS